MDEKFVQIISHLRNDSRISLTNLSRKTNIPISTIFDKLNQDKGNILKKHTSLIDFEKMGYSSKTIFVIKSGFERRDLLKDYLLAHSNVNNFYLTNSGYDFMIETIFKNQRETQHFLELLERTFNLDDIKSYNIIEDIHREKFLTL